MQLMHCLDAPNPSLFTLTMPARIQNEQVQSVDQRMRALSLPPDGKLKILKRHDSPIAQPIKNQNACGHWQNIETKLEMLSI